MLIRKHILIPQNAADQLLIEPANLGLIFVRLIGRVAHQLLQRLGIPPLLQGGRNEVVVGAAGLLAQLSLPFIHLLPGLLIGFHGPIAAEHLIQGIFLAEAEGLGILHQNLFRLHAASVAVFIERPTNAVILGLTGGAEAFDHAIKHHVGEGGHIRLISLVFFFNPIQLLNGPANLFLLPKLTANDLLQRWIVHEVILADPFNDLLSIICKAVILQRYPPAAVGLVIHGLQHLLHALLLPL